MKYKDNAIIILLVVILILLIYIAFKPKAVNAPLNSNQIFGEQVLQNNNQSIKPIDTYTYTNHGFSIELPKGFVPSEQEAEGGPYISLSLPNNKFLSYVKDASFWEKWSKSEYTYKGKELIGETMFEIYSTSNGSIFYWFKQGNVGYQFFTDKELLKTFKFIGWGEPVNNFKKDGLSFSYPIDIKASYSIASDGYKVVELTRDGVSNKITIYYAPVGTNAARNMNGCFEMSTQKVTMGGKEFTKCSSKAEPTDIYVLKTSSMVLNMMVDNWQGGTEIGSFIDIRSMVMN